ncbi:MAG TPA: cation diffusion facilitator family transporter [Bacillales bacterium]|nr:cation diffusion facilitator family transporter [Bacillales bacterium]
MSGSHDHGHGHSHGHNHSHNANKKALMFSFILTTAYMLAEVIGGLMTNSLALLSDAGHMVSDAISLAVGLAAFKFGEKVADESRTYGYKRFEILAALFNGVLLIVISLYILWEAYNRFLAPSAVQGTGMLIIAILGMLVNLSVAWILLKGDTSENLNLRAAFLHVIGDLVGSIGAIVAALLILLFSWEWADPVASILVSILILVSGWRVTRDAIHVLMEGKPHGVDVEEIKKKLLAMAAVKNVHDLHIWSITSDFPSLSCHLVVAGNNDRDVVLREATDLLHQEFSIKHTTVQIEGESSNLKDKEECCN